MKATITATTTYDVTLSDGKTDKTYTGLRKVSEWNGLWELRAEGVVLIVSAPRSDPYDVFQAVFEGKVVPQSVTLVSATPDVMLSVPAVKY